MSPKGPKYRWEIAMDLALFDYNFKYEADYVMKKPEYLTWTMLQEGAEPAPGFWKLMESEGKTLMFNGTTADLRKMGWILGYAVKTEPTLEHALLGCQALVAINSIKKEIENPSKSAPQGK